MVVDNSLTDSLFNSNRVLNAETVMMMKEHIVDTYGEITYTMGNGCSGGSIQQNTAASIFPGLLDGIQPSCDYPDSITTGLEVTDCVLLVNFYAGPDWTALMSGLTQAADQREEDGDQRPPRSRGLPVVEQLVRIQQQAGQLRADPGDQPDDGRDCAGGRATQQLPAARRARVRPGEQSDRHAVRRPDLSAAVWGTTAGIVPGSTRALQTGDNVGIQYGLKALLAGAITAEEFVTLNEKIGGFDADFNRQAARSTADLPALDIAYRAGIVAERREPRQATDHRLARLRRAGHPLHLAQLRRACPHRRGQWRQPRQPGDVALRHRALARRRGAGHGRDAEARS